MNWTHTSTAAVAAKKSGAPNTAKIRKTVINVIVHIFLAILAFIWVLPIFWVILTSFRGEKGSYVSTFFPKTYTFNNYIKLFTDTSILNFPKMFYEYLCDRNFYLHHFYHLCTFSGIQYVKNAI